MPSSRGSPDPGMVCLGVSPAVQADSFPLGPPGSSQTVPVRTPVVFWMFTTHRLKWDREVCYWRHTSPPQGHEIKVSNILPHFKDALKLRRITFQSQTSFRINHVVATSLERDRSICEKCPLAGEQFVGV